MNKNKQNPHLNSWIVVFWFCRLFLTNVFQDIDLKSKRHKEKRENAMKFF